MRNWPGHGSPGPGRWINVYPNAEYVFMIVAGLRVDTATTPNTSAAPAGR
jgi:hypothetical protein